MPAERLSMRQIKEMLRLRHVTHQSPRRLPSPISTIARAMKTRYGLVTSG